MLHKLAGSGKGNSAYRLSQGRHRSPWQGNERETMNEIEIEWRRKREESWLVVGVGNNKAKFVAEEQKGW